LGVECSDTVLEGVSFWFEEQGAKVLMPGKSIDWSEQA